MYDGYHDYIVGLSQQDQDEVGEILYDSPVSDGIGFHMGMVLERRRDELLRLITGAELLSPES